MQVEDEQFVAGTVDDIHGHDLKGAVCRPEVEPFDLASTAIRNADPITVVFETAAVVPWSRACVVRSARAGRNTQGAETAVIEPNCNLPDLPEVFVHILPQSRQRSPLRTPRFEDPGVLPDIPFDTYRR